MNMQFQASMIFENELEPKQGVKIPFGIHSNCKITSIEHKEDEYTDINFEDSEGKYHNKRLWAPKGTYPQTVTLPDGTKKTETADQATEREGTARLMHVLRIADLLGLKDQVKQLPPMGYDALIKRIIDIVTPGLANARFNLKLIYDSEGMYSTFGNFPDYIESYKEGVTPSLQYSKWEKENRCERKEKSTDSKSDNSKELDALFKKSA